MKLIMGRIFSLRTENKFYNIGHRGAAAYVYENTIESFQEAINRHADMIEYDIRRTADGVIVVCHDSSIRSDSGDRKAISKITLRELQDIAKFRGFILPTIDEVLDIFGRKLAMNIEIKAGRIEQDIVRIIGRHNLAHPPVISSFLPWVVKRLKGLNPKLRTGIIIGRNKIGRMLSGRMLSRIVLNLGVDAVHFEKTLITQTMVKIVRAMNKTIFVWTVDEPDDFRRLIKFGVDGIITNRPDILYETCIEMTTGRNPIIKKIRGPIGKFAYLE